MVLSYNISEKGAAAKARGLSTRTGGQLMV